MSGRIPQSFINDLLARIDIIDVIDSRMTLKKSGKNYTGLCPFHNEKTPSFSVNQDKQFYYCFGCQASGTALTFLIEHDRLDFVSAVESLASTAGMEVPREKGRNAAAVRTEKTLYEVLEEANRYFQQMLRTHAEADRAVEYLKGRGITGLSAKDFEIGFAPPGWNGLLSHFPSGRVEQLITAGLVVRGEKGRTYDRFRDRIVFPIRDTRGRVIAFGGRVLGDEQPKYLNSPESEVFHKGRELYGLFEARRALRSPSRLLLVEGYMDVVALAQEGFPESVATLGTATSVEHFEKMFRYVPEVICCFDGDAAGRSAAWKALNVALPTLSQGRQLRFMFLPDGEDPDSLVRKEGKNAFEDRVSSAVYSVEYLFQQLSRNLDLNALEAQARLAEDALPLIAEVPAGVLRELMLNRLSDLTEMPVARFEKPSKSDRRLPRSTKTNPSQKLDKLSERLLSLLVQHPEYGNRLTERQIAGVLGSGESEFVRVLRNLLEMPGMDSATLLGSYSGDALHSYLVELGSRELLLADAQLEQMFIDGVQQLIEVSVDENRRALVQELHKGASRETLAEYWKMTQEARQPGKSSETKAGDIELKNSEN